ncbi:MAG: deoxynucleoside kinase, partial [Bacteroidota bacterium]
MNYSYIAIEGNIGAGKTTLCKLFCNEFTARPLFEAFEANPFLEKFYLDRERYAFSVELSFLADRYKQLTGILAGPDLFQDLVIADFALFKSLAFSRVNLQEDELKLFQNLFQIMYANLPKPELVIYLHLNIEKLFRNIANRGRAFEKKINSEYLLKVQDAYLTFLKSQSEFPAVLVDVNEIDFLNRKADWIARA